MCEFRRYSFDSGHGKRGKYFDLKTKLLAYRYEIWRAGLPRFELRPRCVLCPERGRASDGHDARDGAPIPADACTRGLCRIQQPALQPASKGPGTGFFGAGLDVFVVGGSGGSAHRFISWQVRERPRYIVEAVLEAEGVKLSEGAHLIEEWCRLYHLRRRSARTC